MNTALQEKDHNKVPRKHQHDSLVLLLQDLASFSCFYRLGQQSKPNAILLNLTFAKAILRYIAIRVGVNHMETTRRTTTPDAADG